MIAARRAGFNMEADRPMIGYLGIGSNLGRRTARLRQSLKDLRSAGLRFVALSSVWETEPEGRGGDPWFLNMVAAVRTRRSPHELLDVLLDIERRAGRVRTTPNAPRTLDCDLLLLGEITCRDARLELPHPRMWQRRFVLEPLREIAPALVDPRSGRTVVALCERLRDTAVVRRVGRIELADIIPPSTPGPERSAQAPVDGGSASSGRLA